MTSMQKHCIFITDKTRVSKQSGDTMKTMKVVSYFRTSGRTELQNGGYGLSTQKSEVRKMIRENGWKCVGEFVDDGISGSVVNRDGLQKMFLTEDWDCVVVYSTDRLWRCDLSTAIIKHTLKTKGVDVKSVKETNYTLYSDNPSDFLVNSFMELLNSYEKMIITQRLVSSRRQKVLKTKTTSGLLPIGYCWKKKNNVKRVVVDQDVKEVVKDIFGSYNKGMKVSEIYRDTNLRLIEMGRKKMSYQGVKHILSNPFYSGVVRWGDIKIKNGSHTPLISKHLFTKCRNRLAKK